MKRMLTIAVLAVLLPLATARPTTSASDVSVTPLLTTPLPEYPGKEVQMIVVEYPPGGADPVHRHYPPIGSSETRWANAPVNWSQHHV